MTFLTLLAGCPAISDADLEQRRDRDGDGFQAEALGGTDCNDEDASVNPRAQEVCDGIDNDCDDAVNAEDPSAAAEEVDWYLDADGDTWGDEDVYERSCFQPTAGWVHRGGDCDDTDPDQVPDQSWYLDGDGDDFGLPDDTPRVQCERPEAHVLAAGDCDDANVNVNPGAVEVCNDPVDDDCDGLVDDADPDLVADVWYPDLDGDGYGADDAGRPLCNPTTDAPIDGDCDDADPEVNPDGHETWYDGVDQDCAGNDDFDQDGDGASTDAYGGTDCDDGRSWVHPYAPEICNAQADDCDPGGWSPADETGLAHFVPLSGAAPFDVGAVLVGPGAVANLAEDGTLSLCPGTWTGSVVISSGDVLVRAPGGLGSAVLDAAGVGAGLVVVGPQTQVTVEAMELTGGVGHDPSGIGFTYGGCLYADAGRVELDEVDIHDCASSGYGGLAWILADDMTMRGVTMRGGSTVYDGGGAWLYADALEVDGLTVESSVALFGSGGGLWLALSYTDAFVTDLASTGNSAGLFGGGLYADRTFGGGTDPALSLSRPVIEGNFSALDGGGASFASGITTTVVDGSFAWNTAIGSGGGLKASSPVDLVDTAVTDNAAFLGGGVYAASQVGCHQDDGTSVIHRNSGNGVNLGAFGSAFVAGPCDLGTGANDNTTSDVVAGANAYMYGANATFTCSATSCSP